jgi:D-3-phosphoglycerate dehydrogenase
MAFGNHLQDYDALIVRSGTRVTKEIIEKSQLTIVGRAGTGVHCL